MDNRPIGIFDSGIGGLTVANAVSGLLPNESIIYFGDTAHLPYGDKSAELIKSYALHISEFLLEQKNCKALVIACNTASAVAYEYLRDKHKGNIPVVNVIDPIVEAIVADDHIKRVGIIATNATIQSGVYQEKLKRRKPGIELFPLATPLLVPMIEEGFANDNISSSVIHNYLEKAELETPDALILGCTHYVLIRDEIDAFYKKKVKLFDSTLITASKLKHILTKENLLSEKSNAKHHFYISDFTEAFNRSAERFYGNNIQLEEYTLTKNNQ